MQKEYSLHHRLKKARNKFNATAYGTVVMTAFGLATFIVGHYIYSGMAYWLAALGYGLAQDYKDDLAQLKSEELIDSLFK